MPINTDLLIAAPMLQDYLVDKDTGMPLANGVVTLYKDNARSFLKNWYYQTGVPGAYTWIALDNPLHLSSVGTIQDPNGNDVIPFYYPYQEDNENISEPYYVTVDSVDENGEIAVRQFTRENFPFLPSNPSPSSQVPTLRNYILNNVYWRNIGSLDAELVTDQVIAPSQHEGYTNGDIRFIKDITGANDDLIFSPMTTTLDDDITPEYYINMQCTGIQLGEAVKCIQYPLSLHAKTLQNQKATIVIHAQNVSGSPNNYIDVQIYQYTGTGAISPSSVIPFGDNDGRIVLNNDFTKYELSDFLPDASTLDLGEGGDDALFVRISFPLSALFNINHTKPQLYLGDDVPDNDFDTYDQIETIINSPRTGDIKMSLSSFNPFGYVACQDGTIGNSSSGSTYANQYTWPLYDLLWSNVNVAFAPMFTSGGGGSTRGASAIADWSANKRIGLPKALGRVLMGLPTSSTFTYNHLTQLLTVADATLYYTGSPVTVSNSGGGLPPAFVAGTVYYVIPISSTTFKLASSYANALAGTAVAAGASDGTGTQTVSFALGGSFGEDRHTQLGVELALHSHVATVGAVGGVAGAAPFQTVLGSNVTPAQGTVDVDVANTGASTPFNVVQPSVYYNVFLKL